MALILAGSVIAGEPGGRLEELKALNKAGRYAEAESGARALLADVESQSGPDSVETAGVLAVLVESLVRGGKARDPETRGLAERALSIEERVFGTERQEVVPSLNGLANVIMAIGDYAGARRLFERALAIREKVLPPDHPDVARSLNNLAIVIRNQGDQATGRVLHERALAILEKALGPDDIEVGRNLNNLGNLLRDTGDYKSARPVFERAVGILEKGLGPDHPMVAGTMNNLATVFLCTGDYAAARPLYERALAIWEKALGPDHPDVSSGLGNLAILLWDAGDYAAARPLYERALAIREKTQGPDHPDVARVLNNFALLLKDMGDSTAARLLDERALAIWEKALGPDHPSLALGLNNLGNLLNDMGDYESARPLFERALALQEKALGPDHPELAATLVNLSIVLINLRDDAKARTLSERALAIQEKALGPDHHDISKCLNTLADMDTHEGDVAAARTLLERSVAIGEKALGADHPAVAENLSYLARLRALQGEYAGALGAALEVERIAREHLRLTSRALSERQALRYAAARRSGLDLALTLAGRGIDGPSSRRVLDAVVRSRAVVFDEMAARHHAIGSLDDPRVAGLSESLTRARSRLANLVVRGLVGQTPERYRTLLDEARDEKERAERALVGASPGFAREFSRGRLGLDEVAASLPQGSALVAFAQYNKLDLTPIVATPTDAHPMRAQGHPSYLAFILRSSDPNPAVIDLGPAEEIDGLVMRWRKEVTGGALHAHQRLQEAEVSCRVAGVALRKKVWDPLFPLIKDYARVFVVPDGSLNLINLSALPVDGDDYLVERGPLVHYVSTERDLVPSAEIRRGEGLLVLGGPTYDATTLLAGRGSGARSSLVASTTPEASVAVRRSFRGERSSCGDFSSVHFDPLPGTEREAGEVADLWKHGKTRNATRLTGPEASEAAFKEMGPGRRVLHLATHGFFVGGRCASALEASPEAARHRSASEDPPPATGDNPLVLSGLALAGANQRAAAAADEEDGILTAEEIAAMDLSGVEWAVLSACDTGVGEIKAGEGLFGLRRAFQVAGARTVIMSLWSVEDEATRAWMRTLYEERLGGASTAEAVRNASRRMIKSLRRSGLPAHPYYWAGFVAVGDWK